MSTPSNHEQQEYWNHAGGERWVRHQDALDQMVRPFGDAALARLLLRAGEHVLDLGCGCGDTLSELARSVGERGSVTGIDLSVPMLARARQRAPFATLIEGDASAHAFARKFDAMYSRFGVMFFADAIAAFRHLAQALVPGGRIAFACWRTPADNPWVTLPIAAVRAALPNVVPPAQDTSGGPGPFSFSKPSRIEEVLRAAGFATVDVAPLDSEVTLSDTGLGAAVECVLTVTPVSRLVAGVTSEERARAAEAVARVLEPHLRGEQLGLRGGAWTVSASLAAA
jgi:ubiquinone/menaquinone biosynthesis C-methylase UbiE